MKKILIALMILGAICANTFAQEYDIVETGDEVRTFDNEVYLTVGTPSLIGLFAGMFGAIAQGIADSVNGEDSSEKKDNDPVIAVSGGYNRYFFDQSLGVGALVSYEKFSIIDMLTVQAKVTGQYGWEHFKIYHALSGGILFVPGNSKPTFAFDVTLLGLKLDFERWDVFVEASGPTTGMIKAGAAFKF